MLKRKHADAFNMKMYKDTRRCFQQARATAGSAQESVYSGVKQPAYTTCDNGDQQTDDVGKPQKLFAHRMPIKVCAAAGSAQESVDSGVKQLSLTQPLTMVISKLMTSENCKNYPTFSLKECWIN